jgi:biotin-dependent carboxylase-like uncharacterized protein
MTALVVRSCGPMTSLQDGGRSGYQRFGVSRSGAMDRLALAYANTLVGNAPGAAAIEFMLLGGSFSLEGGTARVAFAGAAFALSLDDQPLPPLSSVLVEPGQILAIAPASKGIFGYLAVAGGFALPPDLGSLSLQKRAGIGGIAGRAFLAGDQIPLLLDTAGPGPEVALDPVPEPDAAIRVVLGPQDDYFTPDAVEAFLTSTFAVTAEADRMGYRLAGPTIAHAQGYNIVSDGLVGGSVQVPGSGSPIVMMSDHQTTGGYPKIATVISADLGRLAQRRTGEQVRFQALSVEDAQAIARDHAALVASLPARSRVLHGGLPDAETLLGLNLAGYATNALDPEPEPGVVA